MQDTETGSVKRLGFLTSEQKLNKRQQHDENILNDSVVEVIVLSD